MDVREEIPYAKTLTEWRQCASILDFWLSCRPGRDADPAFFEFQLAHGDTIVRPHVIAVYRGARVEALLIGRLESTKLAIKVGYLGLGRPSIRLLTFLYGGWLGNISEEIAKLLVATILRSLADGEAEAAMFHYPEASSPLVHWARELPSRFCRDYVLHPEVHPVRDLAPSKAAFMASLSRNERYQQKRREQRLNRQFAARIVNFRDEAELKLLVTDVESVAEKSYQRRLGVGFADTEAMRTRLRFEARQGWLHANVLYLNEQPCAFWIASLRAGVFFSNYLGFDARYAPYAPGMYLMIKVMEELSGAVEQQRAHIVDFGGGDAEYKQRLATRSWQELQVYIFAPHARPIGVNMARNISVAISQLSKKTLEVAGLKKAVKKRFRKTGLTG